VSITGFTSPWWFLLLFGVLELLAGYLIVLRLRRRYGMRFANLGLLERVAPKRQGWARHVPTALFLVALVGLTVALAGPTAQHKVPRNRATVMLNRPRFDAASFLAEDAVMPKRYPSDQRERAVRMVMDRLEEYPSPWAAAQALGPKLGVGAETLRKWIVQAQVDGGARTGPTSEELAEIKRLRLEVRDLKEANEILKAASIFFAGELDPRHR